MAHEQSETVQREDGRWINVYGKSTPKAGQQLPDSGDFDNVEQAVEAAKKRSHDHGKPQAIKGYADGGKISKSSFERELEAIQGEAMPSAAPIGNMRRESAMRGAVSLSPDEERAMLHSETDPARIEGWRQAIERTPEGPRRQAVQRGLDQTLERARTVAGQTMTAGFESELQQIQSGAVEPEPGERVTVATPEGGSEYWKAIKRAFLSQNPEMGYRSLQAHARAVGADQVADWASAKSSDARASGESLAPRISDLRDIKTVEDAWDYVAQSAGQAVGTSVFSILGAIAGGAVTGGRGAGPGRIMAGRAAGAAIPSWVLNSGDVFGDAMDDPEIQKLIQQGDLDEKTVSRVALAFSVPVAALDSASMATLLGSASSQLKKQALERAKYGFKNYLTTIAAQGAKGAAIEGATEAGQKVIAQWARDTLGGGPVDFQERFFEALNEGVAGMLGGAQFGGGSAAVTTKVREPKGGRLIGDTSRSVSESSLTHRLEDGTAVRPLLEKGQPASGLWENAQGEVLEASRADPVKAPEPNSKITINGVEYELEVTGKGTTKGTARMADGQEMPIERFTEFDDVAKERLGMPVETKGAKGETKAPKRETTPAEAPAEPATAPAAAVEAPAAPKPAPQAPVAKPEQPAPPPEAPPIKAVAGVEGDYTSQDEGWQAAVQLGKDTGFSHKPVPHPDKPGKFMVIRSKAQRLNLGKGGKGVQVEKAPPAALRALVQYGDRGTPEWEAASEELARRDATEQMNRSRAAKRRAKVNVGKDSLLEVISKIGGADIAEQLDTVGDTGKAGNKMIAGVGPVFRKPVQETPSQRSAGHSMDDLITYLRELGYLTPRGEGVDDADAMSELKEKIREEFDGIKKHYALGRTDEAMRGMSEDDLRAQFDEEQAQREKLEKEALRRSKAKPEEAAQAGAELDILEALERLEPGSIERLAIQTQDASYEDFLAAAKEKYDALQGELRPDDTGEVREDAGGAPAGSKQAAPGAAAARPRAEPKRPAEDKGGPAAAPEDAGTVRRKTGPQVEQARAKYLVRHRDEAVDLMDTHGLKTVWQARMYMVDDRSHGDEAMAEAASEVFDKRGAEFQRAKDVRGYIEAVLAMAPRMRAEQPKAKYDATTEISMAEGEALRELYSSDTIAMESRAKSASFGGKLVTVTGQGPEETYSVVELVPVAQWDGPKPRTYGEKVDSGPEGFYHGMLVKSGGKQYVMRPLGKYRVKIELKFKLGDRVVTDKSTVGRITKMPRAGSMRYGVTHLMRLGGEGTKPVTHYWRQPDIRPAKPEEVAREEKRGKDAIEAEKLAKKFRDDQEYGVKLGMLYQLTPDFDVSVSEKHGIVVKLEVPGARPNEKGRARYAVMYSPAADGYWSLSWLAGDGPTGQALRELTEATEGFKALTKIVNEMNPDPDTILDLDAEPDALDLGGEAVEGIEDEEIEEEEEAPQPKRRGKPKSESITAIEGAEKAALKRMRDKYGPSWWGSSAPKDQLAEFNKILNEEFTKRHPESEAPKLQMFKPMSKEDAEGRPILDLLPSTPPPAPKERGVVLELALEELKKRGWNLEWPFVPADLINADFREHIAKDPELSDDEKALILSFAPGGKNEIRVEMPPPPPKEPEKKTTVDQADLFNNQLSLFEQQAKYRLGQATKMYYADRFRRYPNEKTEDHRNRIWREVDSRIKTAQEIGDVSEFATDLSWAVMNRTIRNVKTNKKGKTREEIHFNVPWSLQIAKKALRAWDRYYKERQERGGEWKQLRLAMSTRAGYSINAENSPLYEKRSYIGAVSEEAAAKALQGDATARRVLAKGEEPQDGELVGARLNINVFKSTGVPVTTIHRGNKGTGYQANRGLWGGEVIGYEAVVTLKNAFFNVHQRGREQIAAGESSKFPMASVDGNYVDTETHSFDGIELHFNPKREHLFVDKMGRVMRRADEVTINGTKAYARGTVEYYGREDVPERAGAAPTAGRLLTDEEAEAQASATLLRVKASEQLDLFEEVAAYWASNRIYTTDKLPGHIRKDAELTIDEGHEAQFGPVTWRFAEIPIDEALAIFEIADRLEEPGFEEDAEALADEILHTGHFQAVVVGPHGTEGFHRVRAAQILGRETVPAYTFIPEMFHAMEPGELGTPGSRGTKQIAGFTINLETLAGENRKPGWPVLQDDYGEIVGVMGKDKDYLDVFVAADTPGDFSGTVFVVNQTKADGSFDEHKILLGYGSLAEARRAYQRNYEAGWDRGRSIIPIGMGGFRAWTADSKVGPKAGKLTLSRARLFEKNAELPPPGGSDPLLGGAATQLDLFAAHPIPSVVPQPDVREGAALFEHVVVASEQQGTVKVPQGRIDTAQQAATVFRQLAKSPRERFQILGLTVDNKPLVYFDLFAGTITQTAVYPREVALNVAEILGVKKLWAAHNHPSGIAAPSKSDASLGFNLEQVLKPLGVELRQLVIAGKSAIEYRSVAPGGMLDHDHAFTIPPTPEGWQEVPVMERMIQREEFDKRPGPLSSPAVARSYVTHILKPTTDGLLFIDAQNRPIAWYPMSFEEMDRASASDMVFVSRLLRQISRNNPAAMMVIARSIGMENTKAVNSLTNLKALMGQLDVKILDGFVSPELSSMAERGLLEPGVAYEQIPEFDQGSTVEQVHEALKDSPLYQALHGRIEIVPNGWHIPRRIFTLLPLKDGTPRSAAVYNEGRIYLIANRMPPGTEMRTLIHESIGHMGIEHVLRTTQDGLRVTDTFQEIYNARKADIDREAKSGFLKRWEIDTSKEQNQWRAAAEWIAVKAEAGEEQALWDRVVAAIRNWLRQLGAVKEWTDNDILYLLQLSRYSILNTALSIDGRPSHLAEMIGFAGAERMIAAAKRAWELRKPAWMRAADNLLAEFEKAPYMTAMRRTGVENEYAVHSAKELDRLGKAIPELIDRRIALWAGAKEDQRTAFLLGSELTAMMELWNHHAAELDRIMALRGVKDWRPVYRWGIEFMPKTLNPLESVARQPEAPYRPTGTREIYAVRDGRLAGIAVRSRFDGTWQVRTGTGADLRIKGRYRARTALNVEEARRLLAIAGEVRYLPPNDVPPMDLGVLASGGRSFDLEDTDLSKLSKGLVHPRTIASFDRDFAPVVMTLEAKAEYRDQIISSLYETLQPFFDAAPDVQKKVSSVLELGRLKGEVYGTGREPVVATNTGQKAALSIRGDRITLTDEEKSLYWSVRRAMDSALDFLRDEHIREHGLDPNVIRTPQQVIASIPAGATSAVKNRLLRLAQELIEVRDLRMKGYVPFSRWGAFGIAVRNPLGQTIHFEQVESIGKFFSGKKAIARADELRQEYPNSVVVGPFYMTSSRASELVDFGLLDNLASVARIDPEQYEAVRQKLVEAQRVRGFARHLLRSENIPGYSPDFTRAVADYVVGLSSYVSRRRYREQLESDIGAIPAHKPRLIEYARGVRQYADSPQEEWQWLRQTNYVYYLAAVPMTAAANLTQPILTTYPILASLSDPATATAHMARAYRNAMNMTRLKPEALLSPNRFFDPTKAPEDVREGLTQAWEKGILAPMTTMEMMGLSRNRAEQLRKLARKTRYAIEFLAHMFMTAERTNRIVTYIAGYRMAALPGMRERILNSLKENGLAMQALSTVSSEQFPAAFAEYLIDETQFRTGKVNRATLQRGVGTALFQFKDYPWQMIELYMRMGTLGGARGKLALAMMMLLLGATAGMWGLPFADNLRKLFEFLYKGVTDRDLDLKLAVRDAIVDMTESPRIAEAASAGVFRYIDDAPDLSTRIGLGNVLPNISDPASYLGVPFDLLWKRGEKAAQWIKRDEYSMAAAQVAPNFLKNWVEAEQWKETGIRSQSYGSQVVPPEDLEAWDIWMKRMGGRTRKVAEQTESEFAQQRASHAIDDMRRAFTYRIGVNMARSMRAQERGDFEAAANAEEKVADAWATLERHNEQRPLHEQVIINPASLKRRVEAEILGPGIGRDVGSPRTSREERRRIEEQYSPR